MRQTSIVPDGMIVAAGSAMSYAIAFAYRSGYSSHFGLPPLLLSPTLGDVLQAAGAVGAVLLLFFYVADAAWPWLPSGTSAVRRAARRVLIIILALALLALLIRESAVWLAFLAIAGLSSFFEFVFPLISQRRIAGYERKLAAQEKVETSAQQLTLFGSAMNVFGRRTGLVLAGVLFLLPMAHLVGLRSARMQEEFFVLADRPGYVVATMSDGIVILCSYNAKRAALTGTYLVEPLSESRTWLLRRERVGRLKAVPPFGD